MCITLHGSSVCMSASFHLHVIHDDRLIVCSLLLPRSVFLRASLRLLPLLFHTLLALWPALLPSGQRQGKDQLHLSPNEEYCHPGDIPPSRRFRAQRARRLPLLRDYWNALPGGIRRHTYGALVLVWRGTRRWDHRESAIFITVHSGARRTSGPKTSLSLLWRVCCQLSPFLHTHTRTGRPVHKLSSCKQ